MGSGRDHDGPREPLFPWPDQPGPPTLSVRCRCGTILHLLDAQDVDVEEAIRPFGWELDPTGTWPDAVAGRCAGCVRKRERPRGH